MMTMKRLWILFVVLALMVLMSVQCEKQEKTLVWESEDPISMMIDGVLYEGRGLISHSLIGAPEYPFFLYEEGDSDLLKDTWSLQIVYRTLYSSSETIGFSLLITGRGSPKIGKYSDNTENVSIKMIVFDKIDETAYQYYSTDAWLEITDLEFIDRNCKVSAEFGFTGVDVNAQKEIIITNGCFDDFLFLRK